jgi:hypothetical protein
MFLPPPPPNGIPDHDQASPLRPQRPRRPAFESSPPFGTKLATIKILLIIPVQCGLIFV